MSENVGYGPTLPLVGGSLTGPLTINYPLTVGGMTQTTSALASKSVHRFDWTNAQVVALGAVFSGDITICTLPTKTVITNAYVILDSQASGTTTLTLAMGRTGALYIDYIVALDAKVVANTIYGDLAAERGTNLTGFDLPSITGTTVVKVHFISTLQTLDQVLGCTGCVYLETLTLP